ncbi:phytanoyl-CoA dioxygenase family protein [bacterium SCSIO 12741]|nr:phytanoyl-CoA dioxygenase family protein [bacterium SCSIO 12741]
MSLKNHISNWIQASPWIRGSRLYYKLQRYRLYKDCQIDYSLTKDHELLKTLEKDGLAFIPNFLPDDQIDQLAKESMEMLELAEKDQYPGYFQNGALQSVRIGRVDQNSELAKRVFYDDARIQDLAKAYVSKKVKSSRREVDFKLTPGAVADADMAHFDDWRQRFKAFLFLTDVGPENGPMNYWKGSHIPKPWMLRYFREYDRDGGYGRFGHFFEQEMLKICEENGYEKHSCTGKKGTLLLADFRGLHSSTPLISGRRLIMGQVFEM